MGNSAHIYIRQNSLQIVFTLRRGLVSKPLLQTPTYAETLSVGAIHVCGAFGTKLPLRKTQFIDALRKS